jgi:hypothetical protein
MIIGNAAKAASACLVAFLVVACAVPNGSAADRGVPAAVRGDWTVVSAKVRSTGVTAYLPDDPALLGQRLRATDRALSFQDQTCGDPRLDRREVPVGKLIEDTFEASPAEMGVDLADEARPVFFVTCGTGEFGPTYPHGSWIAQIPDGRIALNWYDGVLLFLERRPTP